MIKLNPFLENTFSKSKTILAKKQKPDHFIDANTFAKTSLSKKAIQNIRNFEDTIEDFWKNANKNKSTIAKPEFVTKSKKGETKVVVKPIYGNANYAKSLMISLVDNKGKTENFLIDRIKPDNFTYEELVPTKYGSRTTKTYNNIHDKKNSDIVAKLEDTINNYFPNISI